MSRLFLLFGILSLLLGAPFSVRANNMNRNPALQNAVQIDAIVHQAGYDRPDTPGMSVIVIRDGKVLFKRAYGLADVEAGTPNTTGTTFRLASISKQFTAMAILMLMERGRLRLDSHLSDFFPDFPEYGREITIRHLLTHTAGLPDYVALIPGGQKEQLNDQDALHLLEQQKSGSFPPGTRFEYSNSGYVLLGLIVARASGEPFARFLQKNIFQPLQMSHTAVLERGQSNVKARAFGYSPKGDSFERTDQSVTSATQGDGCIYSSVEDMYRWDQALYTSKLVRKNTLKMAFTPAKFGDRQTSDYGFGWFINYVRGFRQVWHGGGTLGFRSQIVRMPDQKFTVIVLTNRNDSNPAGLASRIARIYFPALTVPEPHRVKLAPAVLESYAGHYDVRGGVSTFTAREGRLFWTGISAHPLELLPLSSDTFFYANADINPERDWRLTFEKDAQGHMVRFVYHANEKVVFMAPYLGPLAHKLVSQLEPDPALTQQVKTILEAFALGGKAVEDAAGLTPGVQKDLSNTPLQNFAGLQSLTWLFTENVGDRGLERHGGKVDRVLTYRFVTDKATRYVLVYLTAGNLITDEDVVED